MRTSALHVIGLVVSFGASACGAGPQVSLAAARHGNPQTHLVDGPTLVDHGGHYVLRYRFAEPAHDGSAFAMTVFAGRDADVGYYYFAGVVQSTVLERGQLVERSLSDDGLDELARQGRVYWLDPDGSRHRIAVVVE